MVGNIRLNKQYTQGGTALAGTEKCGGNHIVHYLFGQGGGVHNHAVLAAGFGDKGNWPAGALSELLVDGLCCMGGAGKGNAGDSAVGD